MVNRVWRKLHQQFLVNRFLSTSAESVSQTTSAAAFRCLQDNPVNQTLDHVGLFYTIPESRKLTIFKHGGLPKPFYEQCDVFHETCLMIRKPALEIINYLKHTDFQKPLNKYVLYGRPGVGKSLVMAHVIDYASLNDWVLVHVPWVGSWLRSPRRDMVNSTTKEGCVNLPTNAVKWLVHFKTQNATLLNKLDVRVKSEYTWSKREVTHPGDPLLDLVELGVNRIKYSSDCISAILNEVKLNSKDGRFKTLVAIDGFNSFFHPNTRVKTEEKVMVPPTKVSFIPSFMELTKNDWHNAVAVLTCDELSVPGHDASHLPFYQLTREGFEYLDPFIPVYVPVYSEKEIISVLSYYRERKWLQSTQGDEELMFTSGGYGYRLMNLCDSI